MGILDRINRLVRANVNDMIQRADLPERALDHTIGDMQSSIREARTQLHKAERSEEQLTQEIRRLRDDAYRWEDKAAEALRAHDESLARRCMIRKQEIDAEAEARRRELDRHRAYMDDLARSLDALQMKLDGVESRRRSFRSHLSDAPRGDGRRQDAPPPESGRVGERPGAAPPPGDAPRYTFPSFSGGGDRGDTGRRDAEPPAAAPRYTPPPASDRRDDAPPARRDHDAAFRRGRRAFAFDDDMRREFPEEVFDAAEPFEAFDRMSNRIRRDEADVQASSELAADRLGGYDDPLRDDLEDRFRRLQSARASEDALSDLRRRTRDDAPPSSSRPRASSSAPSSPPASSSSLDAIKRQLAEDLGD